MNLFRARLGFIEQLFVELLAGPQSRELDVNIFRIAQPREHDHVFGEVDDLHRIAHIEDQHISRRADSPSLDDQLDRFGNRHEEPLHIGMRDRDRPPAFDLLAECRDDAAHRVQHIAEANRDKARAAES